MNKKTAIRQARAYVGEMTPHGVLIVQMAELLGKKPPKRSCSCGCSLVIFPSYKQK